MVADTFRKAYISSNKERGPQSPTFGEDIGCTDMSWLPQACTNRGHVYIEKSDTTAYSLLLAAMFAKSTVQVAVTDQQPAGGVCRITMTASPTWN